MTRIILWVLTIASLIGIYFSSEIHTYLKTILSFYSFKDANLLQVILAVIAGVFATKATDSSSQLKRLMKVPEINEILAKADTAQERYEKLEQLIKDETKRQFARDMLVNHRKQLINHWEQITEMERVLSENLDTEFDPRVRNLIRNYILKTKYVDYAGRGLLGNIPIFGGILDLLLGPLWDTYYSRNLEKFEKSKPKK
ncbi:hypothetical protein [Zobellia nedashkovskayae]|uniref:hypothetical protein n=1 Tax=Zobellia nedashkovskayae TaxID=2779510 RepID=UPI00188B4984|nr:hypothetical protein [Zobellia nedashkovskayae]